jgi:hypothetical protein
MAELALISIYPRDGGHFVMGQETRREIWFFQMSDE